MGALAPVIKYIKADLLYVRSKDQHSLLPFKTEQTTSVKP